MEVLNLLTDPAVLTAILTLLTVLVPAIGIPAWATGIIAAAARVAVKAVEQTMDVAATPEEKKAAAFNAVKELLPLAVKLIPGTSKKIDHAIEAGVGDLNFPA